MRETHVSAVKLSMRELRGVGILQADIKQNATLQALTFGAAGFLAVRGTGARRLPSVSVGLATTMSTRAGISRHAQTDRLVRQGIAASMITAWLAEHTPVLGIWALEADNALAVVRAVVYEDPSAIVELGSGASTMVIAQRLAHHGRGHLYSVDHQHSYQKHVEAAIAGAGLADYVTFVCAPLVEQVWQNRGSDGTTMPLSSKR